MRLISFLFALLVVSGLAAQSNCEISIITVTTGACTSNTTYTVTLNFQVFNPTNDSVNVYANNGPLLGAYPISSLPLTIVNFPYNGGPNDVVKVCMTGNNDCCREKEFPVPACLGQPTPCAITNLTAVTGDCTGDSSYVLTVNFQAISPAANQFELWANNQLFGTYSLSALPLTINNFPYNGGANDVVKVCIKNNPNCCATKEFPVPACILNSAPCEIYNLSVVTGECTSNTTYRITLNFLVANGTNSMFGVWANGQYLGNFPLSSLPLTINNFPYNGGANDVVKVCINDNSNCCKIEEFPVPACILNPAPCEIYELSVVTGECTGDSTYKVTINFLVANGTSSMFGVWANGQYLGNFPLSSLPLTINNFPYNGGANDVVKVCINDNLGCCKTKEFPVPACILNPAPCEIYELSVVTGECTGDSTYRVTISFLVANSTNASFDVWANGQFFGNFPLSSLPLTINNFPYNGGANDVIKVCINDNSGCCKTKEFPVPACILNPCHIYDLNVQTTGCLCGQFFAVLTFSHTGGSAGGFDIGGNGQNYGNFPYSQQQPIILGPLEGNAITAYEFVVKDHEIGGCKDVVELGIQDCPESPAIEVPVSKAQLFIAPNPVSDWLSVTTILSGTPVSGAAQVNIMTAEGRVVRSVTVSNAASFSISVGDLPAGTYQLQLDTDLGRITGLFSKH